MAIHGGGDFALFLGQRQCTATANCLLVVERSGNDLMPTIVAIVDRWFQGVGVDSGHNTFADESRSVGQDDGGAWPKQCRMRIG